MPKTINEAAAVTPRDKRNPFIFLTDASPLSSSVNHMYDLMILGQKKKRSENPFSKYIQVLT